MILERVSGRSVTELLQTGIWDPLGMEFGRSWSLDSRADGAVTQRPIGVCPIVP